MSLHFFPGWKNKQFNKKIDAPHITIEHLSTPPNFLEEEFQGRTSNALCKGEHFIFYSSFIQYVLIKYNFRL
jgi:hypothetical protein